MKRSLAELDGGNSRFFYDSLPPEEQWRLFAEFRHSAAYLDIETTGVSGMDRITTIALYDGRDIRCYVRGRNLDEFKSDIRSYGLLVTYNGKCFDVPFIQRALGIRIDVAHIDLRYVLRSLGYSGGLKGCEKQIGIDRGDLEGLDGYFAVILWNDFIRNRNERALETLLAYNVEDVVNLEALMIHAYNRKLGATPFGLSGRYPLPTSPQIPFKPDAATINRLRRAFW
ncbi:MAG: ribonuclease H-like domain-containing protein [Candidatus Krumholzibacteria bacterium]